MEVIRSLAQIKRYRYPVVAIGVFDGMHRGHRRIIGRAATLARRVRGTSIVLTFYPDPHRQESIYSLEHRLRLIAEIGIDVCVVIPFTASFARLSAADFIATVLCGKLAAKRVYIGENFHFGRGACGNYRLLERFSRRCGFKVVQVRTVKVRSRTVSSTTIRALISAGKLHEARVLLGRPVSVYGKVIHGSSLGRRLGYPTANLDPAHEVIPPAGIYAVRVSCGEKKYKGACYIGSKPSFVSSCSLGAAHRRAHVEVYIFNFHQNIYGDYLEIKFIKKIRTEQRFASAETLRLQIKNDISRIRTFLK